MTYIKAIAVSTLLTMAGSAAHAGLVTLDNFGFELTNGGFSVGSTTGTTTPVPLPASGLLLLGGLASIGALRKLRKPS